MNELAGKHIVLGLSGGVACYKAADLCRQLIKEGATVQVVMTEAAEQFITPVTMQALSGRTVYGSQWDAREPNNMPHINLSREADAILIAPCSADFIARVVLGVGNGDQACGETGDGRMLEPVELLEELIAFFAPKVLAGRKVLVTAGPTFEAIDPVRGITNLSSGKMGFAIARAAREAGAEVTLVAGPVHVPTPRGVQRVNVQSAQEMLAVVQRHVQAASVFVATAAVADWRPASQSSQKIKKDGSGQTPTLGFVENPDILAMVAKSSHALEGDLFCVGFAAESHDLLAHATAKRARKGVPLLVGKQIMAF